MRQFPRAARRFLRTSGGNIRFALKFILDGLVEAGVLPNDSWRYVGDISDSYVVDRRHPRVVVTLTDSEED